LAAKVAQLFGMGYRGAKGGGRKARGEGRKARGEGRGA